MPGDPRFGQNLEPMLVWLLLEAVASDRSSVIEMLAVAGTIAESNVWLGLDRAEGEPEGVTVTGFG